MAHGLKNILQSAHASTRLDVAVWVLDKDNSAKGIAIAETLEDPAGNLDDLQIHQVQNLFMLNRDEPLVRGLWTPPRFVRRSPGSTMGPFLGNMPFDVGDLLDERERFIFSDGSSISREAVESWGAESSSDKPFREPRLMSVAFDIWRQLDDHAHLKGTLGHRVDPLDFVAAIYPDVGRMLDRAHDKDNVIEIVQPWFMERIPFQNQNYATFSQEIGRQELAVLDRAGSGVIGSTRQSHARGEVERPLLRTMWNYANGIARDANGDKDFAQMIFDYLMVMRFMPWLVQRSPDGSTTGMIPAVDMYGMSLFDNVDPNWQTRYILRVIPGDPMIVHLAEKLRNSGTTEWPLKAIVSGEFDLKLKLMADRIAAFELLPGIRLSRDDSSAIDLSAQKSILESLKDIHLHYKNLAADRKVSVLTEKDRADRASFYRKLDNFYQLIMYYTHARGEVRARGMSIPFEAVPRLKGVKIARVIGDRVSIFGSDIATAATDESWPKERITAIVRLRALLGNLKDTGERSTSTSDGIHQKVERFWPKDGMNTLPQAISDHSRLERDAVPVSRSDASLHRAIALKPHDEHPPYFIYLGHLNVPSVSFDGRPLWQRLMSHHHGKKGYDDKLVAIDSVIADKYFRCVRHPHYIYDGTKLRLHIAEEIGDVAGQDECFKRLTGFFSEYGIRTVDGSRHALDIKANVADKLASWAFSDYIEYFSTHYIMGVKLPKVNRLMDEIVDRVVSEHKDVDIEKDEVRRNLVKRIDKHNAGVDVSMEQKLKEYPLPSTQAFRIRFDRHLAVWTSSRGSALAAEEDQLRMAAAMFNHLIRDEKPAQLSDVRRIVDETEPLNGSGNAGEIAEFYHSWITRQRNDLETMRGMINSEAHGIVTFVRDRYEASMITDDNLVAMAMAAVHGRLTGTASEELMDEALSTLGEKFDPYPEVKMEVASFLVMATSQYLHSMRNDMELSYLALAAAADSLRGPGDRNAHVSRLKEIASQDHPDVTNHIPAENSYDALVTLEHRLSLLQNLNGEHFDAFLSEDIAEGVYATEPSPIEPATEDPATADPGAIEPKTDDTPDLDYLGILEMHRTSIEDFTSNVAEISGIASEYELDNLRKATDEDLDNHLQDLDDYIGLAEELSTQLDTDIRAKVAELEGIAKRHDCDEALTVVGAVKDSASMLNEAMETLQSLRTRVMSEQQRRSELRSDTEIHLHLEGANQAIDDLDTRTHKVASLSTHLKELLERLNSLQRAGRTLEGYETAWRQYEDMSIELVGTRETLDTASHELRSAIERSEPLVDTFLNIAMGDDEILSTRQRLQSALTRASGSINEIKGLDHEDALRNTRSYLLEVEQKLPLNISVRNLPTLQAIDTSAVGKRMGVSVDVDYQSPKASANEAVGDILSYADSLILMSDGKTTHIAALGDSQRARVSEWLEGNREEPLEISSDGIFGEFAIPAGTRPLMVQSVNAATQSKAKTIVSGLRALAKQKSPEMTLLWKLMKAQRRGNAHATAVIGQVIAALTQNGRGKDNGEAIRMTVISMRDHMEKAGVEVKFRETHRPLNIPHSPASMSRIKDYSADDIMWAMVKGEFKLFDFTKIISEHSGYYGLELFHRFTERLTSYTGKPIQEEYVTALFDFILGEDGDHTEAQQIMLKGRTHAMALEFQFDPRKSHPDFQIACMIWTLIRYLKGEGSPRFQSIADDMMDGFSNSLWKTIFPEKFSRIKAKKYELDNDAVKNYALGFYDRHALELTAFQKISHLDPILRYQPGQHRVDSPFVMNILGQLKAGEERTKRLVERMMSSAHYQIAGSVLSLVFSNNSSYQHLETSAMKILREYAGCTELIDSTFYDLKNNSMQALTRDLVMMYGSSVADGFAGVPAHWETEPDEELAKAAPETGAVLWHSVASARSEFSWLYSNGKKPMLSRHGISFTDHFPEFAGAAMLLASTRATAGWRNRFERLFKEASRRMSRGGTPDKRKGFAAQFRELYLNDRDGTMEMLRGISTTDPTTLSPEQIHIRMEALTHFTPEMWQPAFTWAISSAAVMKTKGTFLPQ